MVTDPNFQDWTGIRLQTEDSLVEIVIVRKVKDADIYVCQEVAIADPTATGQQFFATTSDLESMEAEGIRKDTFYLI